MVGLVSVGVVANTNKPEPVSSVTAAAKLALDGVAKNVATPVPKPDTPVDMGNPVALVSVALDGVPSGPPLYRTVPDASGSVNVRLAVSVVGVSVTP